MDIKEAIIHARQVAEGCGVDSRDCAYQHDCLADWLEELVAYRAKVPFDRLDEAAALVKAGDEGRVVELDTPRKPLVWGDDDHETCLCPDCGADLMGIPYGEQRMVLQCPVCGQYLDATKAITRAEAEAAIGGGGDG